MPATTIPPESPILELTRTFIRVEWDLIAAQRLLLETAEQRLRSLTVYLDGLGEPTVTGNGHAGAAEAVSQAVVEAAAASIAPVEAAPASEPPPAPIPEPERPPAPPFRRDLEGLTDPIPRKPGKWRASPPVPPGYRFKRGEAQTRMLAAMPGTAREIAERSKVKLPVVTEFCGRMFREGKIKRVGTARSPLIGVKSGHGVHSRTGGRRVHVYQRKD